MIWLWMALAGGLGAAARVAVSGWVDARWREPYGTVAVNVAGALALAVVVAAGAGSDTMFVVGTGFLGGLTTFSTWMVDTVSTAARLGPGAALARAGVLTMAVVAVSAVVIGAG